VIPEGLLVTVPDPVPDSLTVKLYTDVANVAATDVAAVIVTLQFPVPEHPPPDQPEKVEPLFAKAAKATDVPDP
jgi:hypothetical protein